MSSPIPARRGRPSVKLPPSVAAGGKPPSALVPLEPAALSLRATERLRELIVQGDLKPGQPIAEAALSTALGISRTPLREALRRLATEGLIALRPNRGAVVTPLDAEETRALFETLAGVERLAAELAAQRASDIALHRLADWQERLERQHLARKRDAYFSLNQEIHRLIVELAANPVLRQVHESLFPRAERSRLFTLRSQPRWDESVSEHRAILEALLARDAERAGALLAEHVRRTGEAVIRLLFEEQAA